MPAIAECGHHCLEPVFLTPGKVVNMDVLASKLVEWFETNSLLYATASICLVIVVGTLLGWVMDLVGQYVGVDTHEVQHHREHL